MSASLSALSLVALVFGAAAVFLVLGLVLVVGLTTGVMRRACSHVRRGSAACADECFAHTFVISRRRIPWPHARMRRWNGSRVLQHSDIRGAALSVLTTEERRLTA